MAKNNPNRQELIQFINQLDKELPQVQKLEECSNGVHYLYLLHKIHPNVVKIGKINVKAFHEHENVNNLKLLALYLSQVKAPFTFQVPKVAARNYQQNLNLLKNLYKYYYSSFQSKGPSLSKESKERFKSKIEPKKHEPKIVVKLPQKPNKPAQMKKYSPENSGLRGIIHDSQTCMQQIKKTLVVAQVGKKPQQDSASQKIERIKEILGMETNAKNYSTKCSPSKTKKNQYFTAQKTTAMTENTNKTDEIKVKSFSCLKIIQVSKQTQVQCQNNPNLKSSDVFRRKYDQYQEELKRHNLSLVNSEKQSEQNRENNKHVSLKKDIQKSDNNEKTQMKPHTNTSLTESINKRSPWKI